MSSAHLDTSKPSKSKPSKRKPGRLYAFVVVGLATFLLGLAVFRPPFSGTTVRAVVSFQGLASSAERQTPTTGDSDTKTAGSETAGSETAGSETAGSETAGSETPGSETPGLAYFVHHLTDAQALLRAADQAGLLALPEGRSEGHSEGEETKANGAVDQTALVDRLKERLGVGRSEGQQDGLHTISIEYTGASEEPAMKFVDGLTRELITEAEAVTERARLNVDKKRQQADAHLAKARQDLADAKLRLNRYIENRVDQLERAQKEKALRKASAANSAGTRDGDNKAGRGDGIDPKTGSAASRSSGNSQPAESSASKVGRRNPRWIEVHQQLTDLEARLDKLLVYRTRAHPVAIDAQRTIDDLRRQLADIPEYSDEPAGAPSSPEGIPRPSNPLQDRRQDTNGYKPQTELPTRTQLMVVVRSSPEYHEAYGAYQATQAIHRQAVKLAKEAAKLPDPSGISARVVETAHVTQRHGGSPSRGQMSVLGLISALTGWFFASRLARRVATETLSSLGDVVESLQLEICGSICTADGPEIVTTRHSKPRIARFVTLLSELTLTCIAALLAYRAVVDRAFVNHLAMDPFAAYVYAVDCVKDLLI